MYFYTSISEDAPKLNNTWGDFNKVINYIVDGGTEYPVVKIEPHSDQKVKIFYDNLELTKCPWALSQTVTVSGTTNYNKDYFIESISEDGNFVIGYNSTIVFDTSEIENPTEGSAKTKASGIRKIFGGVEEKRTVIQFENSVQYRIDDRDVGQLMEPPVNWDNTYWLKFARVCMSSTFESLDFTPNRQYPFNATRPDENIKPHGNYVGQSLMVYNTATESHYYITQGYNVGYNHYKIWASENIMYIQLFGTNYGYNGSYSRTYIMGGIESYYDDGTPNGLLQSNYPRNEVYNTSNHNFYMYDVSGAPGFMTVGADRNTMHCALYDSLHSRSAVHAYFIGEYALGNSAPSGYGGVSYPNVIDGSIVTSDVLVYADNLPYGKMYDLKWINSNYRPWHDQYQMIDGDLYVAFRWICNSDPYTSTTFVKLTRG